MTEEKRTPPRGGENQQTTIDTLFNYMRNLDERMIRVDERMEGLDDRLREHMNMEELGMKGIKDELSTLSKVVKAFPHIDGEPDIEGHYADHVSRMHSAATNKARIEKMKDAALDVVVKGVTYGTIILLLMGARDWLAHPIIPSIPSTTHEAGK
jgi:hypothetical protein